jgi:hypothetical protein
MSATTIKQGPVAIVHFCSSEDHLPASPSSRKGRRFSCAGRGGVGRASREYHGHAGDREVHISFVVSRAGAWVKSEYLLGAELQRQ